MTPRLLNFKLLFSVFLIAGGGTLLPRIPYEEGFHRLVVRIDQIGLKDAHVYLNPFFTVSVKGNWKKKDCKVMCTVIGENLTTTNLFLCTCILCKFQSPRF